MEKKRKRSLDMDLAYFGYAVRVSDPCCTEESASSIIIDGLKAGAYSGYVELGSKSGLVSSIGVKIDDSFMAVLPSFSWKHEHDISIDNSQVGIFAEDFFVRTPKGDCGNRNTFCGECRYITEQEDEPFVPLMNQFGFVTSGFNGHGCFPLYIARNEKGEVIGIKVGFGNE